MEEIILVLGGGGARGLAHIGAIRAVEEAGAKVRAVAGCSMGGIVGAFLAAGHDAASMEAVAEEIRYERLLAFGDLGGIVGGDGIARELGQRLPDRFEDLGLPLLVTAVDVQEGALAVLNEGALVPALRATSALPGILSPVEHEGRYLVDGGLLNNLPTDLARTFGPVPVVAVDVAAPPDRRLRFEDDRGLYARLKDAIHPHRALTVELFMKAFDVPQALVTQMRLSMAPPDVLVRPALGSEFGVEQFGRREEAIAAGYEATATALAAFSARRSGEAAP